MILSLLPQWFPTEVAFIGLAAFVIAVLLMNRGRWWMVNGLAQDESFVVAVGVVVAAASGKISDVVGTGSPDAWLVIGVAIALLGVVIWWSDDLDISGLL